MKSKLTLFAILVVLLFVFCSQTGKNKERPWKLVEYIAIPVIDSSQTINGRHPNCIQELRQLFDKIMPVYYTNYQAFELFAPAESIKINLNTMSKNLENAKIYVKTFNNRMDVVLEDSLDLKSSEWSLKELEIPARDARFVRVIMNVEGDTVHIWKKDVQRLWFDTVTVKADGKSLYPAIATDQEIKEKIDTSKIIPVGMNDFSQLDKRLKGKKIIGLGETIHGTVEMGTFAMNYIQEKVRQGECKLVLLESPLWVTVRWDLYVQGLLDDKESEDMKREIAASSAFQSGDMLIGLIETIKAYNSQNPEKVHLLGMDVHSYGSTYNTRNSARDLISCFLNRENREKILPLFDFMEEEPDGDKIMEKIAENETFLQKEIGTSYVELVKTIIFQFTNHQYLKTENTKQYSRYVSSFRDYYMWVNIRSLIANFLPDNHTAIVYAHNHHLNKSEAVTFLYPSAGYYMAKEYGDQYVNVAMVAKEGKCWQVARFAPYERTEMELQQPLSGSIEKFCSDAGQEIFCYHAENLPQDIQTIRFWGLGEDDQQFVYDNPTKNNDYFIYFDKSTPLKQTESSVTKMDSKEKIAFLFRELPNKRDSIFQQRISKVRNQTPKPVRGN